MDMTATGAEGATTETACAPLAGIRVLDLTLAMAGPMCTQRLGEMGADVIKIEAPGGGDFSRHAPMAGVTKFGDATCFVTLNRNKRSLVINLKSDEGRQILYDLVREADVLVQNYRPRVAAKLGIDFASLQAINPRLVYASISGYGEDGPMKDRPGQDLLVQSFTGLTLNGGVDGQLPHPSPLYMVDVSASHMACEGVLAGLVARGSTGRGQEVKVSMIGAIMEMQCQEITSYLATDGPPVRGQTPQVSIYQEPPYGVYACRSGYLAIAQADLDVMAELLERPVLSELRRDRPTQSDASAVAAWRDKIYQLVSARLMEANAVEWDEKLAARGVWCSVVNDYATFLQHEQTQQLLVRMEHPAGGAYTTVAPGIWFSENPEPRLSAAPTYGSDSRAVLRQLGYGDDRITDLLATGVIVAA